MPSKSPRPDTSIDDFLERVPPDMQDLTHALLALVHEVVPDVDAAVYTGWGLIGLRRYIGKRRIYFGFIHPTREYVSIGFEWGVFMTDPAGILEGDDLKQVRFITYRDVDELHIEALRDLIAQAVEVAAVPKMEKGQWMLEQQEIARMEAESEEYP